MKVQIPQFGQCVEVPAGTRLSDALRLALGERFAMPCGGNGTCGACRVRVGRKDDVLGQDVLACQTLVADDMTLFFDREPSAQLAVLTDFQPCASSFPVGSSEVCVAFDIGTTTLAGALVASEKRAFSSSANPQRIYGADVISRLKFAMETPNGSAILQKSVLAKLGDMLEELLESAGVAPRDITRLTFAGNTAMEEFLLGLNTDGLAVFPFDVSPDLEMSYTSSDTCWDGFWTGRGVREDVPIFVLPVLGGFVGGDITAGIFATNLPKDEPPALLLDLGTNGEMALCVDSHTPLAACATAIGPAFEGACISCGMCAQPGAVTEIQNENGLPRILTLDNRHPVGICGSALIDLTALLLDFQLLSTDGLLNPNPAAPPAWSERLETLADGQLAFRLAPDLHVTQQDFAQIQLATAAVRAGIRVLLDKFQLRAENLKSVHIAGGFGRALRCVHARRMGLIPPKVPLESVFFDGNTSLSGAVSAGFCAENRVQIARIPERCRVFDLSQEPTFSDFFLESMFWPES